MHAPAGLAHQPSAQAGAKACYGVQALRARRSSVDVLTKEHGSLRPAAGCKRGRRALHVCAVFEKVTHYALTCCAPSIWLDSRCLFLISCLPAVYRAGHLWGPCWPTSGRCLESREGEQLQSNVACSALTFPLYTFPDLMAVSTVCAYYFPASGWHMKIGTRLEHPHLLTSCHKHCHLRFAVWPRAHSAGAAVGLREQGRQPARQPAG